MSKEKSKESLMIGLLVGNIVILVIVLTVVISSMSDMNKMVSSMDRVLSTEYTEAELIPLDQQEIILLDEKKTLNVVAEDSTPHVLQYSIGIIVDNKAKDVKKVTEFINENNLIIYNEVKKVIQQKSYDEIIKPTGEQEIIDDVVKNLRVKLDTESIVDVVFNDFVYN